MAKRQRQIMVDKPLTQKTKDWTAQTPLQTGMDSGAPKAEAVPASLVAPVVLLLNVRVEHILIWKSS